MQNDASSVCSVCTDRGTSLWSVGACGDDHSALLTTIKVCAYVNLVDNSITQWHKGRWQTGIKCCDGMSYPRPDGELPRCGFAADMQLETNSTDWPSTIVQLPEGCAYR